MRVAMRSSDTRRRSWLSQALNEEPGVQVVDEKTDVPDVVLVDAALMQGNGSPFQSLKTRTPAIIVFAPKDPEQLARFLAAGARGYHCVGEPWPQLTVQMRQVLSGQVRSDPDVINKLLHLYRYLRREYISSHLHEAC